jgi:hypothetical protein
MQKDEQHEPHQKPGMNPGALERQTVPASYTRYDSMW